MPLTFENRHTPIWRVEFYRNEYGDAGFDTRRSPIEPNSEQLKKALLDRFERPVARMRGPLQADVLNEAGEVIKRARIIGEGKVEITPPAPAKGER